MIFTTFHGSYYDVGLQHGKQFQDQIKKAILYYKPLFGASDEELIQKTSVIEDDIKRAWPEIHLEMQGIAQGSGCTLWEIVALNARSELINNDIINKDHQDAINECTVLFSKSTTILAQNRDFMYALQELVFVAQIDLANGIQIIQLMEPGIVGKIGSNNHGIGVCLTFIEGIKSAGGLPIHVCLRKTLECKTIEEFDRWIKDNQKGKTGSITIADSKGTCISYQLYNDQVYPSNSNRSCCQTNQYRQAEIIAHNSSLIQKYQDAVFDSSNNRYDMGSQYIGKVKSLQDMKDILCESSHGNLSICRPFTSNNPQAVGTITSIIMELKTGHISITPGNPIDNSYITLVHSDYQ